MMDMDAYLENEQKKEAQNEMEKVKQQERDLQDQLSELQQEISQNAASATAAALSTLQRGMSPIGDHTIVVLTEGYTSATKRFRRFCPLDQLIRLPCSTQHAAQLGHRWSQRT